MMFTNRNTVPTIQPVTTAPLRWRPFAPPAAGQLYRRIDFHMSLDQIEPHVYEKYRIDIWKVMNNGKQPAELSKEYISSLCEEEELGNGAFGVVYRVKDYYLDIPFALKQFIWVCPVSKKRKREFVNLEFAKESVETEISVRGFASAFTQVFDTPSLSLPHNVLSTSAS